MTSRALALLLVAAGLRPDDAGSSARPSGGEEPAVFAAALEVVSGKDRAGLLLVDPAPVWISDGPIVPDTADYLSVPDETLRGRSAEVRRRGLEPTPAFPMLAGCDGYLVPPGHKDISGCPPAAVTQVAFGPVSSNDGTWEVRRIEIGYGPRGRGITTYRMILEKDGSNWRVIRDDVMVVFD